MERAPLSRGPALLDEEKDSAMTLPRTWPVASLLTVLIFSVVSLSAGAADDPLPSWSDGAAKTAILDFVHATTDPSSPKFVPPEARIATFDQDGTLWVEHPVYSQLMYCLDRVPAVVEKKPELKSVEPFKTVLSGDRDAIAKLTMRDLEKILAATLTGMTVDEFAAEADRKSTRLNSSH